MIRQLDDLLISKIAAGEVIERPASVVKELLENALDSGATDIVIRIKEGGKQSIQVTDNGGGIPSGELHLALTRHATSKITSVDDLFSLHSLGFRGEALASIAAVSSCTLMSKPIAQEHAMQITEGKISPVAHENGTTVLVQDLFGKIPARKKYLKTPSTEQRAIHNLIEQYAICYWSVGFRFFADDELLLQLPVHATLLDRAKKLVGKDAAKHLIEIKSNHFSLQTCGIQGVIGLPPLLRKNRRDQVIFCNNRLIQSSTVFAAIDHGFKGLVPVQEHPVCFIFLSVDPKQVDVNVHPAKTTVKFADESSVYRAVFHAIDDTLKQTNLLQETQLVQTSLDGGQAQSVAQAQKQNYAFSTQTQEVLRVHDEIKTEPTSEQTDNVSEPSDTDTTPYPADQFRILDIINKTFVIASTPQGLAITDFHAAYERLNYEVLKKKHDTDVQIQQLLSPFIYETTSKAKNTLLAMRNELENLGITIDDFGPQAVVVTHVPVILGRRMDPSIIEEIAEDLASSDRPHLLDRQKDSIITRMACKASPRAGDTISFVEAKQLVRDLYTHQLTWTCPHGRPVMTLLSHEALAKMFKR